MWRNEGVGTLSCKHLRCCIISKTAYKLRDRNAGIAFYDEVIVSINTMWSDDKSTQQKWNVIHNEFVAGAKVILGYRQQPDWLKYSAATLQP